LKNKNIFDYFFNDNSNVNNWARYSTTSRKQAIDWFKKRAKIVNVFPCELSDSNQEIILKFNSSKDIEEYWE